MSAGQAPDTELTVEIYPRGFDAWSGSSEHLKAEGIITADIDWPKWDKSQFWSADGFDYFLRRMRPPGMKGQKKEWAEGDYWVLRRSRTSQAGDGWANARLYEKRRDLEMEIWSHTPAAHTQWECYCKAQEDKRFQAFMTRLVGEKSTRRGRHAAA